MCQVVGATLLHWAKRCQKLGRVDLRNGPAPDLGEDVAFQSPPYVVSMAGNPRLGLLGVPLPRYSFERVFRHRLRPCLLGATLRRWIEIVVQALTLFVAALAGILQPDLGIDPEG